MNILLLQGPLGPFFQQLSHVLSLNGHKVIKVHFNAGDAGYSCDGFNIFYNKQPNHWKGFCKQLLKQHEIDSVICYGDCRFYHKVASKLCRALNIDFWALEEGYLRQGYITLEKGGVNANSPFYQGRKQLLLMTWQHSFEELHIIEKSFSKRAWFASYYHIRRTLLNFRYPYFQNHRPWNAWQEGINWLKGGCIKLLSTTKDKKLLVAIKHRKNPLYLLPLQVNEDFQIISHSRFDNLEQVIQKVIHSFATFAPKNAELLIKHHPMDRGFTAYNKLINRLVEQYNLNGRVHYGYELPLPEIYPLLTGTVTVNSTVGLSSLLHSVPTICLGRAIYDIPKLTSQASLDKFWCNPEVVDHEAFEKFKQSLLYLTQIKGNFYVNGELTAINVMNKVSHSQVEVKKAS